MFGYLFDALLIFLMLWIAASLHTIAHHSKAMYDIIWSSALNKSTIEEILQELKTRRPMEALKK